jgi:hypothetical protein
MPLFMSSRSGWKRLFIEFCASYLNLTGTWVQHTGQTSKTISLDELLQSSVLSSRLLRKPQHVKHTGKRNLLVLELVGRPRAALSSKPHAGLYTYLADKVYPWPGCLALVPHHHNLPNTWAVLIVLNECLQATAIPQYRKRVAFPKQTLQHRPFTRRRPL